MKRGLSTCSAVGLAIACVLAIASRGTAAEQSYKIPPGASVQIQGHSAIINQGGGLGVMSVGCACGDGGKGECAMSQGPTNVVCQKASTNGCTGTCYIMSTTSKGVQAPAAVK
jgi:hypothetical protein